MAKLKVCLTGGIASGKTYVSDCLAGMGAFIIDTDVLARQVVEPGSVGLERLVDEFGRDILLSDGSLNRAVLKKKIFTHPASLEIVNGILHPLIWQEATELSNRSDILLEIWVIPLFNKDSGIELFDRVLVVDVLESVQLNRIQSRDQVDETIAHSIISSQPNRCDRLMLASDVIKNNDSLLKLEQKVVRIHDLYLVMINH